jgi:hypothetical protein
MILGRIMAVALAAGLVFAAACGSDRDDAAPSDAGRAEVDDDRVMAHGATDRATAEIILHTLDAQGITASALRRPEIESAVVDLGGAEWNVDIGRDGFGDGINLFPNPRALETWVGWSQGFGGIAVVGDTWALSLESDQPGRATSEDIAPVIARTLGAEVVT